MGGFQSGRRERHPPAARGLEYGLPRAAGNGGSSGGAAAEQSRQGTLRVTALNGAGSSFLLEMGGQRILVNPNLEASSVIPPEKAHEMVDYVVITSARSQFLHGPTIGRMNLAKVNFVTCAAAGDALSRLMVRNLAVLAPGPGGRVLLEGDEGSAPIAAMVAPGAPAMPWDAPEVGFVFVNLETGVALGYEALGQFLGPGASSDREGIPEEAYQVDYLVTSDLREAGGVAKGLTAKGAALRGIVALPNPNAAVLAEAESNPVLGVLLAQDRFMGSMLGEASTPEEFRVMLSQQRPPLAGTRLYEAAFSGGPVDLE